MFSVRAFVRTAAGFRTITPEVVSMRRSFSIFAVAFLVASMVVLLAPSASAADPTFSEFPVSSPNGPGPVTAGTDGNIWFAEPSDDTIGQITLGGSVTEFLLPTPYRFPPAMTPGPDGAVWFTENGSYSGGEGIGRIDPTGTITEFPLPANSRPYGITTGPDGNLWFTEIGSFYRIGRITPSGTVTTFPAPLHNAPLNIVAGPDGALWFTEDGIVTGGSGAIGRITTTGTVSEYVLPTPVGQRSGAGDITVGPDGNLWFTWAAQDPALPPAGASRSVGRITPSGTITEFPVSSATGWPPGGITSGPDGALWFTENGAGAIGRITTTGALTAYPVPTPNSWPTDITYGPDGNLWFSEAASSKIGRISFTPIPSCRAKNLNTSALSSDLQGLITSATPGNTIVVWGTCVGTFTISKNLTLRGMPATLDAQGAGTTLTVSSGVVKVMNLRITGGTGTSDFCPPFGCSVGGGILNAGRLTVIGSVVEGNSASDVGAGIFNEASGTLMLDHTSVTANSSFADSGLFNRGIAILRHSAVSGNSNSAASGGGGGIFNDAGATLSLTDSAASGNSGGGFGVGIGNYGYATITRSEVSGNSASLVEGGGIFNGGTLALTSSTVSGNSAPDLGGGISNNGVATITNSTVSRNSAASAGGIYTPSFCSSCWATLASSIVAGNTGGDCLGAVSSNGYNLVGADCAFSSVGDRTVAATPQAIGIGPLAYNGGSTRTMALFFKSPAKDAIPVGALAADGITPLCPPTGTTDQRGKPRPLGAGCDVGAYELKV